MIKTLTSCLFILLFSLGLQAQEESNALFVSNEGQWNGDFQYKLKLTFGSLFFEKDGLSLLVKKPLDEDEDDHGHRHNAKSGKFSTQALKVKFLNAQASSRIIEGSEAGFYHNYFKGNDPAKWRSQVKVFQALTYEEIYKGIDVNYYGHGENLKYDFHIHPGADPSQISMKYSGASGIYLKRNNLFIRTIAGDIQEMIPEAYQFIDGEKVLVRCRYILENNVVRFDISRYDHDHELIIDPELLFSSFSGSTADNWGFTATYDSQGNLYGGGIVFNDGGDYPTTPGVIQNDFQGGSSDLDIALSKFSPDGTQLLFSTYLGGSDTDIPHSLVVDDNDNLYILGNTGSSDFPVPGTAYQSSFAGGPVLNTSSFNYGKGSDIIITKISSNGKTLLSSTYFGGTDNDGINYEIYRNYGDNSRGEIIYAFNSVFIISNTMSDSIPLVNAFKSNLGGQQDAIIASFNTSLTSMKWGTYFGGSDDESGYTIKSNSLGNIVFGGTTRSNDLSTSTGVANPGFLGDLDGYIGLINAQTGNFLAATYVGTSSEDQVFLLDIDKNDQIYCVGQSEGNITQSSGQYNEPGARQFLKKFNPTLTNEAWSTRFGSGATKYDLVPTAFLIDNCFNIYISGWNGNSNRISSTGAPRGNTNGLPVTNNAEQSSTDGSDFYFMVLDRNAENLMYASFFGGASDEHVDGGTSRFDPSGTIYQAVCAGCSQRSFPTTPGVVSTTNQSNNCNLGVIKLDFETTVKARPIIDYNVDVDTVCDSLIVRFRNESINADLYFWDFGNGATSTDTTPTAYFAGLGTYSVKLIAIDTNCSVSDSSTIIVVHDSTNVPEASFRSEYYGCDEKFFAQFNNTSEKAQVFNWNFGDGSTGSGPAPIHQYPDSGIYVVTLTAIDTVCKNFNTVTDTLIFSDTTTVPEPLAAASDCGDGSVEVVLVNDRNRYTYNWNFGDGNSSTLRYPDFFYTEPGKYTISLIVNDTLCNKQFTVQYPIEINEIGRETFIPNAFSPNKDGINEVLEIQGNACGFGNQLVIFNRWGGVVFRTNKPFEEFWDATYEGKEAPQGVYTYSLINGEKTYRGIITVFR